MYFLLFLLIAMMIMLVVIATTNENSVINIVMIFLSILVLIGGVCFMKKTNFQILSVIKIGLCILLILEFIIFLLYIFAKNNIEISTIDENISLTKNELENFVLVSENDQKINDKTEVIVVTNNVVLKKSMFTFEKNIDLIKKIYFLSSNPTIDSELYEEIRERIIIKIDQNQVCVINFYEEKIISKAKISIFDLPKDLNGKKVELKFNFEEYKAKQKRIIRTVENGTLVFKLPKLRKTFKVNEPYEFKITGKIVSTGKDKFEIYTNNNGNFEFSITVDNKDVNAHYLEINDEIKEPDKYMVTIN